MQVHIISIGDRMPGWVDEAYQDYAKRLPPELRLQLTALQTPKRSKSSQQQLLQQEAQSMIKNIKPGSRVIALDERGQTWDTKKLSQQMKQWMDNSDDISLLIGGPDGFDPSIQTHVHQRWSLSPLTLPHPMVRIILIEQLYRAWSILQGHPYHRDQANPA